MKYPRKTLSIGLFAVLLLCFEGICFVAADESILTVDENGTSKVNANALDSAIGQAAVGTLDGNEREGLLYMVEEEKLAGDVYQTLGRVWNLRVFNNIGEAEQTHEAAVLVLIDRYGLKDPTVKEVGKFSNATLQKIYNELIVKGETSIKDALEAGAEIEEIDILDLKERIVQTDKVDMKLVYENLTKGSGNHLQAFVSNLKKHGYAYSPKYLSQDEYDRIINNGS
jgi:hypothetical protein